MKRMLVVLLSVVVTTFAVSAFPQPMDAALTQSGGHTLHISAVGLADDPGMYQSVKLKSNDAGLTWSLLSGDMTYKINAIDNISVVKTSEIPVQVFLKVSGYIGACSGVGKYVFDIKGNSFNTFLYFDPAYFLPPEFSCVGSVLRFTKVIPMPVYGLEAGEYSYSVNGKLNGSFVLSAKNVLP